MNNIILIGFMGCGKTSIGSKLSFRLHRNFIDTDKQIEKKHGKVISDIFREEGEAFFRQLETECLKELLGQKDNCIIAVGGGLPLQKENRELLRQLGYLIYLQVTPDTIYKRLRSDTTRPLLQGDNPRGRIEELLNQRSSVYAETADMIMDTDGKELEQIMDEIQEALKKYETFSDERTEY